MFPKALWYKEYRQAKVLLWLMPIAGILCLTFSRYMNIYSMSAEQIEGYRLEFLQHNFTSWLFYNPFEDFIAYRVALSVLALGTGVMLIGMERWSGQQDLSFSLPFRRSQIFWVKWSIGILFLTGTVLFSTAADMGVIFFSPLREFLILEIHLNEMAQAILAVCAWYTLVLLIGTITGGVLSQLGLSLLASIFPLSLSMLGSSVPAGPVFDFSFTEKYEDFLAILNPAYFLLSPYDQEPESMMNLIIPAVYLLLFASLASYAYQHSKSEYDGQALIFPRLRPIFSWGLIICSALLSGALIKLYNWEGYQASFQSGTLFYSYYFAFLAGGTLAYLMTRLLRNKKIKII
ncbi:hypothetical protein [Paenibacillus lutrae]|uniref:ABC transporter permease n=1 Tax=Paenibacillus lutrae TaxID=2078573 RepID=A0A7X3FL62_9BACL|nr:hypothetical protein [Paenibacillus lutrae]MVP01769.1 hypothetical protein [Paenibacillus lutrae]